MDNRGFGVRRQEDKRYFHRAQTNFGAKKTDTRDSSHVTITAGRCSWQLTSNPVPGLGISGAKVWSINKRDYLKLEEVPLIF